MDENTKQLIESLPLNDEDKNKLINAYKGISKQNSILEFKFNRTLVDKAAITNILNASMAEIEIQKEIIEQSKTELNQSLVEVNKQRHLIEKKNKKLNTLLKELRQTQKQLVLSEKMASLGELTAGIAHEIQNPLNFVNNFAEVSGELIDDVHEELNKNDLGEVKLLLSDLSINLEKINHHGKRADSIVKGMLSHSRNNSGKKEFLNINQLAEEYLNLSYHGLRAKDKTFNSKIDTSFDLKIEAIEVVPQDIGRVFLNIINNAFYAVNEKFKKHPKDYQPEVSVSTEMLNDKVHLHISDNGGGMPKKIINKIFQPFFTTKPTGQGTGLGLSMSYDIVKAHHGELTVKSVENEGTTFTITLPINIK
ncbi:ATP-binding protein [Winogradskyella maritima]|uniref:histidine kinase n=1 Tax=Winogradskyella maritima TaxID=1517766 RepID=A0ABV8AHE0_9FLAO|nr:ATP-binding protein [Winogradskyella maritima]